MDKSELANLLRDLAAQLGTTAEHLWTVLVRQAAVSAGMSVVWAVALLTAGVYLLRKLRTFDDQDDPPFIICSLGAGVFIIVGGAIAVGSIGDVFIAIYNPEYYALQKVLSILG